MTFTHHEPGTGADAWRAHPRWPRRDDIARVLDGVNRLVVVAAHPDDESLGAGGLVAMAAARGTPVEMLVLTDGEGSHPESLTCTPQELASRRREEARAAATALGPTVNLTLLGLADGGLSEKGEEVTRVLVAMLGDARDVLILAPWRRDGHPDHEAAGSAAAAAAVRTGARLLEYPVWFWHWADPSDAPWDSLLSVSVDRAGAACKQAAVAAHQTQVEQLSSRPGDEVLLGPALLEHFATAQEVYVEEAATDPSLDDLHIAESDPWGTTHRWYEQRKRDLVMAMLPLQRFKRGLEIGCSRGELAADLAGRCEVVIAVDRSPAAIERARTVVPASVEVSVLDVPDQWPVGTFDLIVLSEVGYFLSPVALNHLLGRVRECLDEHGTVVVCHWRHPIEGWVLDGADVHARALDAHLPPLLARYCDDDVEILVLAADDRRDPHA